jgi:hypothetical protein
MVLSPPGVQLVSRVFIWGEMELVTLIHRFTRHEIDTVDHTGPCDLCDPAQRFWGWPVFCGKQIAFFESHDSRHISERLLDIQVPGRHRVPVTLIYQKENEKTSRIAALRACNFRQSTRVMLAPKHWHGSKPLGHSEDNLMRSSGQSPKQVSACGNARGGTFTGARTDLLRALPFFSWLLRRQPQKRNARSALGTASVSDHSIFS